MNFFQQKSRVFLPACLLLFFCFSSIATFAQAKTSIEKLLTEAAGAVSSRDFDRAKTILQKVLAGAPRDITANTLMGIIADAENDLTNAEKYFALAAKSSPKSPETRNNYGAILLRLNRRSEAAGEFLASLAANPKQPSALINLAQIRLAEKNLPAARELFEKAKAIAPDAEILRALVIISLQLGEKKRAAAEFADYAAFKNQLQPAAAVDVENDIPLAEALFDSGLFDEARQELEKVLSTDNRNISAVVLLSKVYLAQKNIAAAGRLLESTVAAGVDDGRIYLALAEVYEAGGYLENAIPAMRRAIEKEPNNEFYRSRYGLLLVNSKAPAAAAIRLTEALMEFPASPRLWFALGIAQFDDNKLTEANAAFEKALSIDPQLIPALAYRGAVEVERGQYDKAVKIYERAISLNDKFALLYYLLADALLKIADADPKRIEATLKQAVTLDPKLTSAHLALGRLYVRQSRWQEAVVSLEEAAKLEPNQAETFYQLGRVYSRLKRTDESKAALDKFKQISESQKQQKEIDRRELVKRLANVRF